MLLKHPPNENLIKETQLQECYEVTDKDVIETCDIANKFKLFEEFQVSVEKKLLELEIHQYQEYIKRQNFLSRKWII